MEAERSQLEGDMQRESGGADRLLEAHSPGQGGGTGEEGDEGKVTGAGGAGWVKSVAGRWIGRLTGKARVHEVDDSGKSSVLSSPAKAGGVVSRKWTRGAGVESPARDRGGEWQGRGRGLEYQGAPVGLITRADKGRVGGVAGSLVGQAQICPGCGATVSSGLLGSARWCDYSRACYCAECHLGQTHVIIARILQDWDFSARPVSIPAAIFLRENYAQPLFSTAFDLSPTARAKAGRNLELVIAARRRAALLRDYVVQCPNFPNSRAQPEDRIAAVTLARSSHLLADDDTLSLQDLVDLASGELLLFLERTMAPWEEHVISKCLLCHEKGHCCEICDSEERLFRWDAERISICEGCEAISHAACAAASYGRGCRKCARIQRVRSERRRRLSEGSSTGSGSGSGFSSGGVGVRGWTGASAGDLDMEWEQDEEQVERDLAVLLPEV